MRIAPYLRQSTIDLQPDGFAVQEEILRRYACTRRATRQSAVLGTAPLADSSRAGRPGGRCWKAEIRYQTPSLQVQFGGLTGAIRSPLVDSSSWGSSPPRI
jgi:hypothetical protein